MGTLTLELKKTELNQTGLLISKPANQWLAESSTRPIPKMLFGPLWHEGELVISFGPSGSGKSALAVQIGNDICSGTCIEPLRNESISQPVLYCDFELSDKQFEQRYSEGFKNHFVFDDKFVRLELNPDADIPEKLTIEEYLINSIEIQIINTGSKILIIDNITYLRNETEKAKEALPLMKRLKGLKTKYNLSILVLAHTPKRDATKPITGNDLFGSVMLKNFCDSIFALNVAGTDPNIRYIKQIKERFTAKEFGDDNILVFQVEKPSNCLQFAFLSFGKEIDYLRNVSESEKQMVKDMIHQRRREGKSYRDIAKEFSISTGKVQYTLRNDK